MLISSLTQVQRYLAALETLLMEVQANDTNIFFCCRAHDIIVAEQKTYQCLCGVLRYFKVTHASSHFRPLLFLLFLMVIIKISPVFNQGKTAC